MEKELLNNFTENELIGFISYHSSRYGDLLIDFMNKNNLNALLDATKEQLIEYISTSMNKNTNEISEFVNNNKGKIFIKTKYRENNNKDLTENSELNREM